ncbi:MAG: GntR family transcriptional regulator, partial [Pyramidobacter sp.]|nr:GntR family transcriptional regulator [Pyramidobacter sp.]
MADYQLLQDRIYNELRKKILTGGLQAGTIYSETKLATELGVSKTPVKAAILRLSKDHYIDILPSRGFRLLELSTEDLWEMFHIRTAIES